MHSDFFPQTIFSLRPPQDGEPSQNPYKLDKWCGQRYGPFPKAKQQWVMFGSRRDQSTWTQQWLMGRKWKEGVCCTSCLLGKNPIRGRGEHRNWLCGLVCKTRVVLSLEFIFKWPIKTYHFFFWTIILFGLWWLHSWTQTGYRSPPTITHIECTRPY